MFASATTSCARFLARKPPPPLVAARSLCWTTACSATSNNPIIQWATTTIPTSLPTPPFQPFMNLPSPSITTTEHLFPFPNTSLPIIVGYEKDHNNGNILNDIFQEKPESLQFMNRNARPPKKANKGARPCSRVKRRQKRRKYGNWRR